MESVGVTEMPIVMYTVYHRPSDYPNNYVVREFSTRRGIEPIPGKIIAVLKDYEETFLFREEHYPSLTVIPRMKGDDPCIVEVWI